MQLAELLTTGSVLLSLKSENREAIIRELLQAIPYDRNVLSEEDAFKAVLEREISTSTGIGEGVAIPHAKCDIKEELVISLGISKKGVNFSAMDEKPVQVFFMLLSRKDVAGLHIKVLARIALLLRSPTFKQDLFRCKAPIEVLELFKREEASIR